MREYLIDSDFEPDFLFKCVYSQLQNVTSLSLPGFVLFPPSELVARLRFEDCREYGMELNPHTSIQERSRHFPNRMCKRKNGGRGRPRCVELACKMGDLARDVNGQQPTR